MPTNKNFPIYMKSDRFAYTIVTIILMLCTTNAKAQDNSIRDGGEYYIYNVYYNKALGGNADNSSPALSTFGTNKDDNYIFVAEASSLHSGYYWLKQKSTGKYLQASNKTGDTWSIWFAGSLNKEYNSYEWALTGGINGEIISNRGEQINETGNVRIAPDAGKESDTYIYIYYDKPVSERTVWQFVDANYPLNVGRLKLYTDALDEAISQGEKMFESSIFGTDDDKAELATALYNARSARIDASLENIELMETARTGLLAAISNLQEGNYTIWISGSSFNTDNAFTVALNQTSLNSSEDAEAMFIIRNSEKTGCVLTIKQNNVCIGNSEFSVANTTQPHDYQLAFDGSEVNLYIDGTFIGKAEQQAVAPITSVGTSAEWTVFGLNSLASYTPIIVSRKSALKPGEFFLNEYNKAENEILLSINNKVQISNSIDCHILSSNPLNNSSIDLADDNAWIIFDNVRPSNVINNYLKYISIKGAKALNGQNCRVAIYLQGAVVYPCPKSNIAMYGYSGEMFSGNEYTFTEGNRDVGVASNEIQSFTLKRGYMVCLATESDGGGYSRIYVADHCDKEIPVLPEILKQRISYINIRPWNWVSKKGWCSTEDIGAINSEGKLLGTTWFYTWSADRNTQTDMEYVPHKAHIYWPSWSEINNKRNSTAVLGFNEPEHGEQHESSDCSCGGSIDAWKACTKTPEFQASGLRIGSPSPTDASWLTNYIGHCNDMAYRVDFVSFHAYWGTNEAPNASSWKSQLQSIYNNTKRPIWITEWNNGASWTTEGWPSDYNDKLAKQKNAIKSILEVLDGCDFIERYSLYNWDSYYRAAISWDSNKNNWWVTPCGEVYRDAHPSHAYQEKMQFTPIGWFPSMKTDNTLAFSFTVIGRKFLPVITNKNGDFTKEEIIEYLDADGQWKTFYTTTERYKLETTSERSETISCDDCNTEALMNDSITLRIRIVTLKGDETTSEPVTMKVPSTIKAHYTGIDEINIDSENQIDAKIYDIQGQEIQTGKNNNIEILPTGTYIINGKKVFIR